MGLMKIVDSDVEMPNSVDGIVSAWAQRTPDRIALIGDKRSWTYRELQSAIEDTAAWLTNSDVRAGDRVMLVCENGCVSIALYFATLRVAAWPVVVNARLSDREIDEIRDHSGARCMIFTVSDSVRACSQAERVGATYHDHSSFGSIAISHLNEAAISEELDANTQERVAALIYTSGTTGQPKGVMLSHANLLYVAKASGKMRGLMPNDCVYAVLPISHILGLTGVTLGALYYGATLRLASRFDPVQLCSSLTKDDVSVMIGTPSMYSMVIEYAARKKIDLTSASKLRLISSAGAPLDMATKSAAERAFGQTLHNGYGITECGPTITLTALDAPRKDCAIGRLMPGLEAKLVADGKDVTGTIGELWIRSPGVMKGYYRAPEETTRAMTEDGWFKSGDLARIEDGNFFIVGRSKEMIIRFGFNVYPAEVEGALNAHKSVFQSAVIGRTENGSEDIFAFVQPKPGETISDTELVDFAAAQLAPYKCPSRITVIDVMPLTPAGKILKSKLAELI